MAASAKKPPVTIDTLSEVAGWVSEQKRLHKDNREIFSALKRLQGASLEAERLLREYEAREKAKQEAEKKAKAERAKAAK